MKKLLLTLISLGALTLARADFTSYTLVSQSDPLQETPAVSYTFDSLSINMTPDGIANYTQDYGTGATIDLSFTTSTSIEGDSVELIWLFPDASSDFEVFPSINVPGTVFANYGAGDFTITDDSVTIVNDTEGWTAASFNGFEILDLSQQSVGQGNPTNLGGPSVPDSNSTLMLASLALGGLGICRRTLRRFMR